MPGASAEPHVPSDHEIAMGDWWALFNGDPTANDGQESIRRNFSQLCIDHIEYTRTLHDPCAIRRTIQTVHACTIKEVRKFVIVVYDEVIPVMASCPLGAYMSIVMSNTQLFDKIIDSLGDGYGCDEFFRSAISFMGGYGSTTVIDPDDIDKITPLEPFEHTPLVKAAR